MKQPNFDIEYGRCHCGCNKKTTIYRGKSRRFIQGHTKIKPLHLMYKKKHTGHKIDGKRSVCWIWQGYIDSDGYGRLTIEGISYGAHRYMYKKYKGKISKGYQPDHLCRVRRCVRPDHLEAVTGRENTRRGSCTKLTIAIVKLIKNELNKSTFRDGTVIRLANKYKISQPTVSDIKSGRLWSDV